MGFTERMVNGRRGFGKLSGKDIEHLETFKQDGKLFYKIKEVTKQFNLNADRKRFWLGKIESVDSKVMNESMPV